MRIILYNFKKMMHTLETEEFDRQEQMVIRA